MRVDFSTRTAQNDSALEASTNDWFMNLICLIKDEVLVLEAADREATISPRLKKKRPSLKYIRYPRFPRTAEKLVFCGRWFTTVSDTFDMWLTADPKDESHYDTDTIFVSGVANQENEPCQLTVVLAEGQILRVVVVVDPGSYGRRT